MYATLSFGIFKQRSIEILERSSSLKKEIRRKRKFIKYYTSSISYIERA